MKNVLNHALRAQHKRDADAGADSPRRIIQIDLGARTLLKLLLESRTDAGILSWRIEPSG